MIETGLGPYSPHHIPERKILPKNDKVFEPRPMFQLMAMVKNDLRKLDAENLIDDGAYVKTVMQCNDRLGIYIRDVKEKAIRVDNFECPLPLDFEKLYYVAALDCSNGIRFKGRNPFDNNIDQDVIYEAKLDRDTLGCAENYKVVIHRENKEEWFHTDTWTQLSVHGSSAHFCHVDSPNRRGHHKYEVTIKDGKIHTPFRIGTLYVMYIGSMTDEEGNIMFPFHPMITPYYEWMIKEKVIQDAIFNSDDPNLANIYKIAQVERAKAWLDAFNFTSEPAYGHYVELQKKKELNFYHQYFRYFQ